LIIKIEGDRSEKKGSIIFQGRGGKRSPCHSKKGTLLLGRGEKSLTTTKREEISLEASFVPEKSRERLEKGSTRPSSGGRGKRSVQN